MKLRRVPRRSAGSLSAVDGSVVRVGVLGCGTVGASLVAYRPYHLAHHKYAQQAEDPDLVLSAPFPVTRASLRRKILRDLTGQTFFKQRVLFAFNAFASGSATSTPARCSPKFSQKH